MGYPCPASPEDRVEKAAEAKSPAPTPQFPPRGPKDQRLEDPIPLPDPILQQPANPEAKKLIEDVRTDYSFTPFEELVNLDPSLDQTLKDILRNMPE